MKAATLPRRYVFCFSNSCSPAKSKPGGISHATAGPASNPHIAGEILNYLAITAHGHITQQVRAAAGISDGLLRVAGGLETIDDRKANLARGLGWSLLRMSACAL